MRLEIAVEFEAEKMMDFITAGDGAGVLEFFDDIPTFHAHPVMEQIFQVGTPLIAVGFNV